MERPWNGRRFKVGHTVSLFVSPSRLNETAATQRPIYTVSQKTRATFIFMITSVNVDKFSQFSLLNSERICEKGGIKTTTPPPQICNMLPHYLAKRNINYQYKYEHYRYFCTADVMRLALMFTQVLIPVSSKCSA